MRRILTLLIALLWCGIAQAQTTVCADAFTEASNTALTAHVPTGAGTAWTYLVNTSTTTFNASAATDRAIAAATDSTAGTKLIAGCTPSPALSSANIQVTITLPASFSNSNDAMYLVGRWADSSNYYAFKTKDVGASADCSLFKVVAGVVTTLTSLTNNSSCSVGVNYRMRFIVNGTSLSMERDAAVGSFTQILSVTDSSLSASGSFGFGMGDLDGGGGRVGNGPHYDDFEAIDLGSGASAPKRGLMLGVGE